MNVGIYTGAGSMAAYERWQELVSRNIASASLPGFKADEVRFEGVAAGRRDPGEGTRSISEKNGVMPQLSARINFGQGELRKTSVETDFAISGPGFFQVQRADGGLGYTRDGEFHLSADRTLVTKQGHPVMGENGPIALKEGEGKITVNEDGAISQGETTIGKLTLYNFNDPAKLRRTEHGLLVSETGQAAEPVEKPAITAGFLEGSNVSPLRQMVDLITVSRAYEASQRVVTTFDENTGKAIEVLGHGRG